MHEWQGYIIAAMIGLLVGIERERVHPEEKVMGVRTFLFIALLGALAGDLKIWWFSLILALFVFSLIVVSYFAQTSKVDKGLTTEFAGGLVFTLGFIAHQAPVLASIIGPIVTLLLLSKKTIHRFVYAIRPVELETALLLLLGGVAIINLVPNKEIDPWGIFNPHSFGLLVLILASFEFISYLLFKVFGQRKGPLIIGLLGGLVSSTAVTLSAAQNAKKNPSLAKNQVVITLVAQLASLVELLLIVFMMAPALITQIGFSVVGAVVTGLISIFIIYRKKSDLNMEFKISSPLDWKGTFRLAILFALILLAISLVKHFWGKTGGMVISFITALFELHGVSLAHTMMFNKNQMSLAEASSNLIFAVVAGLFAKVVIAWIIDRSQFAKTLTFVIFLMILTMLFTFITSTI